MKLQKYLASGAVILKLTQYTHVLYILVNNLSLPPPRVNLRYLLSAGMVLSSLTVFLFGSLGPWLRLDSVYYYGIFWGLNGNHGVLALWLQGDNECLTHSLTSSFMSPPLSSP